MVKPAATQHKVTQGHSRSLKVTQGHSRHCEGHNIRELSSLLHSNIPPLSLTHTHRHTPTDTRTIQTKRPVCRADHLIIAGPADAAVGLAAELRGWSRRRKWSRGCFFP